MYRLLTAAGAACVIVVTLGAVGKGQHSPAFARQHVSGQPKIIQSTIPPIVEPALPIEVQPIAKSPTKQRQKIDLVARAQKHLGTNPTGWRSLWCARFMAMIAPELARKVPNPNLARSWAVLPKVKPAPNTIAILARGRNPTAGHIGVVKGFDRKGNPIVISGNHNRRVAQSVYPKHRVVAYVGQGGDNANQRSN